MIWSTPGKFLAASLVWREVGFSLILDGMRRRLVLHGLVMTAAARGASAQSPAPKRRIGFLAYLPNQRLLRGFKQAMRDVGYVEGRNLEILERDGEGRDDLLARHAAEPVLDKVDLL